MDETNRCGVGGVVAQVPTVPFRPVHLCALLARDQISTDCQMVDGIRGAVEVLRVLGKWHEAESDERGTQGLRTPGRGGPER